MNTTTELFQQHRGLMFSVAYQMLGSAADAEDVVQETWLRWANVNPETVTQPKAYLVRIATNTALNRLRAAKNRRESYVGPWLPEPLETGPDAAQPVEMAESVSLAMLVVLETLTVDERAVFVLREVFGYPHAQIAQMLGRHESDVRQLAHRARSHVQARRPRFQADHDLHKQLTDRFISAAMTGDLEQIVALLAPDVVLSTDGGGRVRAARRPIHGADKVGRWFAGIAGRTWQGVSPSQLEYSATYLNGVYSLVAYYQETPVSTVTVDIADHAISAIHVIANPDKLRRLRPKPEPR
ncbi:MAG: RNA polymerase sigma-70 factor [Stackebrandtia sp.]